tara:strand:+ start:1196 stop:1441 length:246 start_codon:yes stop_codon:yes gene_type:complete
MAQRYLNCDVVEKGEIIIPINSKVATVKAEINDAFESSVCVTITYKNELYYIDASLLSPNKSEVKESLTLLRGYFKSEEEE